MARHLNVGLHIEVSDVLDRRVAKRLVRCEPVVPYEFGLSKVAEARQHKCMVDGDQVELRV